MRFNSATLVATLITSRVAGLAMPVPDDVVVGGSDAPGDEMADLISAYEQIEDAIPDPVSAPIGVGSVSIPEDTSEVAAAATDDATSGTLSKRGTCAAVRSNYQGQDVSKLTADQWEAIPTWDETALNAPTPDNYYQVRDFRALHQIAEAQPSRGYTTDLSSYDTSKCAQRCNTIAGCVSFNIFFERTPIQDLDKGNCPSSDAQTVIKCTFWGLQLTASDAKNPGQIRGKSFFTSKAGSNAYSTIPPTPSGFTGPVNFGDASIKAPPELAYTYMGIQTFPGVSYNPQACADACNAKTAYNSRHPVNGESRVCRFFNAYVAYKNDENPVFTCTYYTMSFGPQYATNVEQYNSAHDHFTKGSSNGYTLGGSSDGQGRQVKYVQ